MKYDLVASDFDGTLAAPGTYVSERTVRTIKEYTARGGKFCISTGRLFTSILPFIKEMDISGYVICTNGAEIYDIESRKCLYRIPLDHKDAVDVAKAYEELGAKVLVNTNDGFLTFDDPDCKRIKDYCAITRMPAVKTEDKISVLLETGKIETPCKISALMETTEEREYCYRVAKEKFSGRKVCIVRGGGDGNSVTETDATKGRALIYLADKFGVKKERIMAFGDAENDLAMIKAAGLGVAMANASEILIESADYITLGNAEDGVAVAIEKFCLEGE